MGVAIFDHTRFNHTFIAGHLSYKVASERAGYTLGFERPLFGATKLYVGGEVHDLTASDDMWRASSSEASLAALRGLPRAGAYSASKAALSTLLESTRVDLRGTGVHVVTVCPGFIRNGSGSPEDDEGKPFLLDLEDGARRILAGIEAKRRVVHFPWQLSYLMKYVVHNLPDATYDWLIGKVATRR